jgi:hypothetical protein
VSQKAIVGMFPRADSLMGSKTVPSADLIASSVDNPNYITSLTEYLPDGQSWGPSG